MYFLNTCWDFKRAAGFAVAMSVVSGLQSRTEWGLRGIMQISAQVRVLFFCLVLFLPTLGLRSEEAADGRFSRGLRMYSEAGSARELAVKLERSWDILTALFMLQNSLDFSGVPLPTVLPGAPDEFKILLGEQLWLSVWVDESSQIWINRKRLEVEPHLHPRDKYELIAQAFRVKRIGLLNVLQGEEVSEAVTSKRAAVAGFVAAALLFQGMSKPIPIRREASLTKNSFQEL